jgi:Tfp pilus assembly protein PilF
MMGLMISNAAVPRLVFFFLVAVIPCLPQSTASHRSEIEAHSRKAKEYLDQHRPDLAIPEFRAIVSLDPKNVDSRANLGVLLFFQGEYADAIPELRTTLNEQPALSKIQALLGVAEKRTGDIPYARHDLEQAFPKVQEQKIRIETGMELIEIYSAAGDLEKAATIVADLRRLDPTNEAVLYAAYRIHSDLAAESIISLSLVDPSSARMHQAMAHELAKRGSIAEAIENYRAAIKLDPHLPGIHFELAEMLGTMSAPEAREEAEKEYKVALEENPSDEQSLCRLGDIALQKDDLKEAEILYRRALSLRPNESNANLGMAKIVMIKGQPQESEPFLQHAIESDPTNAQAHYRLSMVYRQKGQYAQAKHEMGEYQKYKAMKDKLEVIYHDFHDQQDLGKEQVANH